MNEQQFYDKAIALLTELNDGMSLAGLEPDADLIEGGVLDSFIATELLMHIEEWRGTEIKVFDLAADSIRTLRSLFQLYERR